ncbi:ectonucleotide pyrophosphatase/phosphodiesterase [Compostibacter hankyongensis]|uniref:Alkaline phosphatase family protein n=1 Tax=Compostibacter hankyongensis TaxID=1007089 RepID=A0ABP8FN43_9BACT
MKTTGLKWMVWAILIAALTDSCTSAQPVKHVVLISLDGSRPDFYMDTSWHAPHLQRLKNEGVYAAEGIQSVFPSVTYPSHTTLVTGAYPAHHGIYYNAPFGGKPGHWYWNESAIQCKTLWDAVKEAHLSSGAVMWPVTVGAPIDYNFPVRRPEEGETADVLSVKYPYITPRDLLSEITQKTGREFTPADLGTKDFAQSKTIALIANYIIQTYKPNLMAIHFVGIDHAEHAHGTDGPEVREMVHVTDSLVGTVLQAIKAAGIEKNTAVIITGDHGHADTRATFAPNVYLAGHGWTVGKRWKAKFHAAGGAAFLYLSNKNDKAMLDSVVAVLKNTAEYRNGDFRMLDRTVLDKMGVNPEVALGLAMKEGITANNRSDGKAMATVAKKGSTHGYDPAYPSMHTTFIATGAGIGKHKNISGMGIKDIAPVVATLLGLDFDVPDGKLIPGILKAQ